MGGLQPSGPQNASGGPLRASGGRNSTAGNGGEAARLSRYRAPPKTKRGGPGKPDSPFSRRGEGQPPKTSGGHFEAIGCALVHPGRYTSTGYQGGGYNPPACKTEPARYNTATTTSTARNTRQPARRQPPQPRPASGSKFGSSQPGPSPWSLATKSDIRPPKQKQGDAPAAGSHRGEHGPQKARSV